MPLTLRTVKGTILENIEVDDNFVYLEALGMSKLDANVFTSEVILEKLLVVDGVGSGLDADFLRGKAPNTKVQANSIVERDVGGNVYATYFHGNLLVQDLTGVIPIAMGGTSATTVAKARENLGIGNSAAYDVTTNHTDTRPNVLTRTGDFGWGVAVPAETVIVTDPNWLVTGNWGITQVWGLAAGLPVPGNYQGGLMVFGSGMNLGGNGSTGGLTQLVSIDSTKELWTRTTDKIIGGVPSFSPWNKLIGSQDLNLVQLANDINGRVKTSDYKDSDIVNKLNKGTGNAIITIGETKFKAGDTKGNIIGMDLLSTKRVTLVNPPVHPTDAARFADVMAIPDLINSAVETIIPPGGKGQIPYYVVDGESSIVPDYSIKLGQYVENDNELAAAKSRQVDPETVLAQWFRFSHRYHSTSYPDDAQPANPGELQAWTYDSGLKKFKNTTNSETFIGLVSPNKTTDYIHEVTLKSTDNDDDTIGVLIAWTVDGSGKQHTLSALRSCGGSGFTWRIYYNYSRLGSKIIADGTPQIKWGNGNLGADATAAGYTSNVTGQGWSGFPNGTRVRITRNGSSITCETTQLNSGTYVSAAKLTFDLNDHEYLKKFLSPSSYGYVANSQKDSTWDVLRLVDSSSILWDLRTGRGWSFINGNWTLTNDYIWDKIGVGRILADPYTEKMFYLNTEQTYQRLGAQSSNIESRLTALENMLGGGGGGVKLGKYYTDYYEGVSTSGSGTLIQINLNTAAQKLGCHPAEVNWQMFGKRYGSYPASSGEGRVGQITGSGDPRLPWISLSQNNVDLNDGNAMLGGGTGPSANIVPAGNYKFNIYINDTRKHINGTPNDFMDVWVTYRT